MTPISRRYLRHISVITLLGLVPVTLHSYLGIRTDECSTPAALLPVAPPRTPDPARIERMTTDYEASQFWEGPVFGRGLPPGSLSYAIIRSYDAKRVYYRPEYRYLRGVQPIGHTVQWIGAPEARLPIHRSIYTPTGSAQHAHIAVYLLVYEGRAVTNPYLAQLRAVPSQLFRGTRPMTLFLVSGEVPLDRMALAEEESHRWLLSAWRRYARSCSL